jgi:hypothetical protein
MGARALYNHFNKATQKKELLQAAKENREALEDCLNLVSDAPSRRPQNSLAVLAIDGRTRMWSQETMITSAFRLWKDLVAALLMEDPSGELVAKLLPTELHLDLRFMSSLNAPLTRSQRWLEGSGDKFVTAPGLVPVIEDLRVYANSECFEITDPTNLGLGAHDAGTLRGEGRGADAGMGETRLG